jgi:hypothetical protein
VFLEAHAKLRDARDRSSVWPRIKEQARLAFGKGTTYLVHGDVLGGEAELYLDRLARGAREAGADPLSRALFLELPPDLQAVVHQDVLQQTPQRKPDA